MQDYLISGPRLAASRGNFFSGFGLWVGRVETDERVIDFSVAFFSFDMYTSPKMVIGYSIFA